MSSTATTRARKRRAITRTPGTVSALPSGKYRARYVDPLDSKQKTLGTYATEDDAWRALREHAVLLDKEQPLARAARSTDTTVAQLIDEALRFKRGSGAISERTETQYRRTLAKHVTPHLGTRRVVDITTRDITTWLSKCAPGQPAARSMAYRNLKVVMDYAVQIEVRPDNPVRVKGAAKTKPVKAQPPVITDAEFSAILAQLDEQPRVRLFALLARYTGLRKGELLALRRADIDLVRRVVLVRAAFDYDSHVFKGTKTESGVRAVPLGEAYDDVRAYVLTMPARREALLFASPRDHRKPMASSTVQDAWKIAAADAGRPDANLHQLRHTFGTEAMQAGVPLPDLMATMGHSDVKTTMRYQRAVLSAEAVGERIAAHRSAKRA